MATIKNIDNSEFGEDVETTRTLRCCKYPWYNYFGNGFESLTFKEVKHTFYDPKIPHQGVYQREMKMNVYNKTCKQVFIGTLFTTTPNWKQSITRRMDKLWQII